MGKEQGAAYIESHAGNLAEIGRSNRHVYQGYDDSFRPNSRKYS
jgi:hypothetical protein